tara:strand:- start:2370 stop:2687 length:318 start_codon:yes stop_codon:yes gene_type:complete
MFVKLVEVKKVAGQSHGFLEQNERFTLGEVFLNPEQITHLKEDYQMSRWLGEGLLPEGLSNSQRFTKVFINRANRTSAITVIGDASAIMEKVQSVTVAHKQLLRG